MSEPVDASKTSSGSEDPAVSEEGANAAAGAPSGSSRKRFSSKSLRGTRSTSKEITREAPADASTIGFVQFGATKARPSVTSLDFSATNGSPSKSERSDRAARRADLSPHRLQGVPTLHVERTSSSENSPRSSSYDSARNSSPPPTPDKKKKSLAHSLSRVHRTSSVDAITAQKHKLSMPSFRLPHKPTTKDLDQLAAAALAAKQHKSISIGTARRRLEETQRPTLRRNSSFSGFERHKRSESNDFFGRQGSSPYITPLASPRRSPASSAPSTPRSVGSVQSARRSSASGLKRTTSEPFLHSWEFQHLEVDLYVEKIGYVSDYLEKRWRKKRARSGKVHRRKKHHRRLSTGSSQCGDIEGSTDSTSMSTTSETDTLENAKSDIVYERDGDENVIVAGSRDRLLRCLADANVQDKEYLDIFLSTHLHFISSLDLLSFLIRLYMNPLEDSATPDEGMKSVIRVRVINVLKKWTRNYSYEFQDVEVKKMLASFVERLDSGEGGSEATKWAAFLRTAWETREQTDTDGYESTTKPPTPHIPKKSTIASQLSFLDIHPLEFARQMTLIHHKLFAPIQNPHLISVLKDSNNAENPVNKITAWSNTVTRWVLTAVVMAPEVKKRTVVVAHMIRTCKYLVEMNNFHGAMDLYLGLSHYIVAKLRKTWRNLDSKSQSQWKSLDDLFTPSGGWRNLRKRITDMTPPIVIPPAIWLHDILSIGENDDYWDEEEGVEPRQLINFEKMRLFATVFKNVYRCQVDRYPFTVVPIVEDFVTNCLNAMPSITAISAIAQSLAAQEGTDKSRKEKDEKKDPPKSPGGSLKDAPIKRRSSIADIFKSRRTSKK